jgi:hypothetical protein
MDYIERWKSIIENQNKENVNEKTWNPLENNYGLGHHGTINGVINQSGSTASGSTSTSFPLLPIAMKVTSSLCGDSDERIRKRSRIKKLRRILGDEEFFTQMTIEEYDELMAENDGLVSVKPMSAPSSQLIYMDFTYETEEREKKLLEERRLLRISKLKNILK